MKKVLKFLAYAIGGLILLILFGFLFISFRGIPSYEVTDFDYQVVSTPESLARGKKLTATLCAGCHKNPKTGKLTGTLMLDAPPEFGKIYSQNITNDKKYGIGDWTDAEIVYLLRTGIKRDGQYSPPYMAKLPALADEDMNAILSFLRSDDQLVAADATPDQPCKPSFLTKFLSAVAFKPLPMPTKPIPMPDPNNKIELGEYLATNLECFSCHSADFKTVNSLEPELSVGYYGGGNKPLNLEGQIVLTANLTPDTETGIGNWTEAQFIRALKTGQKEGEAALQYPMVPYTLLTDWEASAIYEYLRTIPAIKNEVTRVVYD
jgi:mono/diheme cytochrome c family protein